MNVAQQYAHVMQIRRGLNSCEQNDQDTYSVVFSLFNECEREMNERLKIVKGENSQPIKTGRADFWYPRPADLVGHCIESGALYLAGGGVVPITKAPEDPGAFRLYQPFTNPTGNRCAKHFWMSRDNYYVGVGWPPQEAGTLQLRYVRDPDPIEVESIYAQKIIRAEVDSEGVVVTFSSPLPAGTIADNDQIGFTSSLIQNRLVTPTSWYYIDGTTNTDDDPNGTIISASISQAKKYRGRGPRTGLYFIVSRISDIQKETSLSRRTGIVPVHYALSKLFEGDDEGRAENYDELYLAEFAGAVPSQANEETGTFDGHDVPWAGSVG